MKDFWRGLLATLPLAPGVVAFGLLYGVMARQVGFSPWEAWAMSLIVHAGSAQFTAMGMWETAGAVPIILATLTINLRHLLMGASVAPYLRALSSPAARQAGLDDERLSLSGVAVLTFSKAVVDWLEELCALEDAEWLSLRHHPYAAPRIVKRGTFQALVSLPSSLQWACPPLLRG